MISRYPGCRVVGLGMVLVVLVLLCATPSHAISVGHGKVLSLVSVGLLLVVLTMTMLGWATTS